MNTFSQTISPSMRLGFLVLPPALLAEYRRRLDFYACTVPALEQHVLALFLSEGHYERHLSRMRKEYRLRRDAVLEAFRSSAFAHRITLPSRERDFTSCCAWRQTALTTSFAAGERLWVYSWAFCRSMRLCRTRPMPTLWWSTTEAWSLPPCRRPWRCWRRFLRNRRTTPLTESHPGPNGCLRRNRGFENRSVITAKRQPPKAAVFCLCKKG